MITIRKSSERGHFDYGWLNTRHTFSFNTYHNKNYMGFRSLIVINEDVVQSGQGFGAHPHDNMGIITYIVSGELAHKDSGGHTSVIRKGTVQIMSAGEGVVHSEFNDSKKPVHLLQIWIVPEKRNTPMRYAEKKLENKKDSLNLIADNKEVYQDVIIYSCNLKDKKNIKYSLEKGRGLWIQLIEGMIKVNNKEINKGDGVSIEDEHEINILAKKNSEFLMFDLK